MCTAAAPSRRRSLELGEIKAPPAQIPKSNANTSQMQQQPTECQLRHHHRCRRQREEKTISFQSTVAIKLVPTHHEMTDSEFYATYHTPEDYDDIKDGVLTDVKYMRRNAIGGANVRSYRGIEHLRTSMSSKARKLRRQIIVEAVLAEQEFQREQGYQDDVAIAETSSNLSIHSKVQANEKAEGDAKEALALFQSHFSQQANSKGQVVISKRTNLAPTLTPTMDQTFDRRPNAAVA